MKHNFQIQIFDEVPSTNDYAKDHIHSLVDRSVIVAKRQTKGRGRFDRVWISGEDLTFTILFKEAEAHSLLAPIAIVEALRLQEMDACIKWPNDILINGKKIAGILIEKVYEGNTRVGDLVGIGVNLTTPSQNLQEKATCIEASPTVLLAQILDCYMQLLTFDTKHILQLYRSYNYLQGRKIILDNVLWEVENITMEGYLCLRDGNKQRILKSEEISLEHIY